MKIGYPCLNRSVGCQAARSFRLKTYSEEYLRETVDNNLHCLQQILEFNVQHSLLCFRIASDLVPYASHPICQFNWAKHFAGILQQIGAFIREHDLRITMHPGQYTLLNSLQEQIYRHSLADLEYHAQVLDAMKLPFSAKVQIHAGGVYKDKAQSMHRFIQRYRNLDRKIKRRLVIENDERFYSIKDCLKIHAQTGLPVLCDAFHHTLNPDGLTLAEAVSLTAETWKEKDGMLIVDYSTQKPGALRGSHADTLDLGEFRQFLKDTLPQDFDLMLEIKDKENSARQALTAAAQDPRFKRTMTERQSRESAIAE